MKKIKILNIILFIIYISFLIYLTLFKNFLGRRVGSYEINLIPFKNIIKITAGFINSELSLRYFIRNIFGNLVAFAPFAYFFKSLFNIKSTKHFTIIIFLIVLFIETMQLILKIGYFDIDDIILNITGSIITFTLANKYLNRYKIRK